MGLTETVPICGTCRFWELLYPEEDNYSLGECRRWAPIPNQDVMSDLSDFLGAITWATEKTADIEHDEHMDYGAGQMSRQHKVGEWPITYSCEWCGEYEERTSPHLNWDKHHSHSAKWQRFETAKHWEEQIGLARNKRDRRE